MRFIVDLSLDGYDNQEDHEKACVHFLYDQLDFSASSVRVEPLSKNYPDYDVMRKYLDDLHNEIFKHHDITCVYESDIQAVALLAEQRDMAILVKKNLLNDLSKIIEEYKQRLIEYGLV